MFTFGKIVVAAIAINIARPVIVAIVVTPIIIAFILFIINSGAYVVPQNDNFMGPISCTQEKTPISFSNSANSGIARRGWEIVSDLYQGFWCYWNRSPGDFPEDIISYPPSYPELFNESLFMQNPSLSYSQLQVCGDCLFWCTELIQKSYRETGNTSLDNTLWSPSMYADFKDRGKIIMPTSASYNNIVPGSVVFFHNNFGRDGVNHVGLVYSVSVDGIKFVQSNAPEKEGFISFNKNGVGAQNLPSMEIAGFGKP